MLRAWAVLASIITLRIILIICAQVSAKFPAAMQHTVIPCAEPVEIFRGNETAAFHLYPACSNAQMLASSSAGYAIVPANFKGTDGAQVAAALDMGLVWLDG